VLARDPAITELFTPTRDGVVDVLARTARFDVVVRFCALLRDVTLREEAAAVERFGVIERDETDLDAVPRDTVAFDVVLFARETVARETFVRVAAVERGLTRPDV
jgi:hypothetical protein